MQPTGPQTNFGGVNLSGLNMNGNNPQNQEFDLGALAHNLTNIHTGSWGLPDLGISEFLGITPAYAASPQQKQQFQNQNQQTIDTIKNSQVQGATDTGTQQKTTTTTTNNPPPTTTNNPTPSGTTSTVNGNVPTSAGATVAGTDGNTYQSQYDPSSGTLVWKNIGNTEERRLAGVKQQQDAANAAYNPIIQNLQDYVSTLQPGGTREQQMLNNVQTQWQNLTGLLPGEQQGLLGQVNQQRQQFGADIQSALGQAIQAAQGLQQQAISRFGGGSSAGLAMTDLANQELERGQNALNQQQIQGNLQFGQNEQNIAQFISQKKSTLDNQLSQAKADIQSKLQDEIAQANQNIAFTQAQREAAKMDALNAAQQFTRQLDLLHTQNYDQLQLFAQAMGNTSGQQINPNLISNVLYQASNSQIPQVSQPQQGTQITTPQIGGSRGATSQDIISQGLAGGFNNQRDQQFG